VGFDITLIETLQTFDQKEKTEKIALMKPGILPELVLNLN
jgi:hypothetical protein